MLLPRLPDRVLMRVNMLKSQKKRKAGSAVAGVALAIASAAMITMSVGGPAKPALAADEKTAALIENGRNVFLTAGEVGCAACHGDYGEGDVGIGPYMRGMNAEAIRAAVESIAEMEFLRAEMNGTRIRQIAAFTEWLGDHQLVKTLAKRGRFIPDRVAVRPGTLIQFVVNNSSRFPRTFVSEDMGIEEINVDGRAAAEFVWTAPAEEGVFTLRCEDCRVKGQKLTVEVSNAAPEFVPASGPLVQVARAEEPEIQRDMRVVEQGLEIFLNAGEVGCSACHGPYAEGDVGIGPYNRGFDEAAIRKALKTVDAMKFLEEVLSDQQITQVAAYYQWLGDLQLIKTRSIRGRFFPERVQVAPGTKVQFVVSNGSHVSSAFSSANMGVEAFIVPGLESADFVWEAPDEDGVFTLRCVICATNESQLTIEVTGTAAR